MLNKLLEKYLLQPGPVSLPAVKVLSGFLLARVSERPHGTLPSVLFRCGDWCRPCWLRKTPGSSPGSTQYPLHPRNHQWENLLLPQCSGSWEPTAVRGESSSRELGGEGECLLRTVCQPEPPSLHSEQPGIYRFLSPDFPDKAWETEGWSRSTEPEEGHSINNQLTSVIPSQEPDLLHCRVS